MRSLPVDALPEVESDLRAAVLHYSSWRTDGEVHVLRMYDETVGWISWNPEAFPQIHGQVRRAILKHSYYIVYFLIETDRSLVLAVLDGRRHPSEIKSLLAARKSGTRRQSQRRELSRRARPKVFRDEETESSSE